MVIQVDKEVILEANLIFIALSTYKGIVVSYEEGKEIIALLEKAESMEVNYRGDIEKLGPFNNEISFHIVSKNEYDEFKVKQVLGVTDDSG